MTPPEMNPANLGLRFVLELSALTAVGFWGWARLEGLPRWLHAVGVPLALAAAWGVFNVPGDPS